MAPIAIATHPTVGDSSKAQGIMRAFSEVDRGRAADSAAHFISVGPALRASNGRATGVDMVIQSGLFYQRAVPATQAAAERNEAELEAAKVGFEIVATLGIETGIGWIARALTGTAAKPGYLSDKIAEDGAGAAAVAGGLSGLLTPTGPYVDQRHHPAECPA